IALGAGLRPVQSLAGLNHRVRGLLRVRDGERGAFGERADEGADRRGMVGNRGPACDEDQLVVGRDTEPIDWDDSRVEAPLLEVHALDVAKAAQDRVDLAADQGGQEVEAYVHLL